MLARPPGGATMRWVVRRGMLSSICAPDKLNPDWCRFLTGGACCLAGDVLADDAGVTVFGVTDTSQTGPS